MEELVSSIKVRDLILAYESISEPVRVELNRPRSKSLGNILNKNFIVRSNDYETLEDIETALGKVKLNLKEYQVYSKEKHVSLQEILFDLLTCVINIESGTGTDNIKKRWLTSEIKTLVAILNQKLPSNTIIPNVTTSKILKENIHSNESKFKYIPYNRSMSVKYVSNTVTTNNNLDMSSEKEQSVEKVDGINEIISVTRLKNFFEEKSKQSKGLEIIIKNPTPAVHYEINIPYTDRNLGAYRLIQKNFGDYYSNSGLLRNVDVSRSMSVSDLRRHYELGKPIIQKHYQSESESDNTDSEETLESVKEVTPQEQTEDIIDDDIDNQEIEKSCVEIVDITDSGIINGTEGLEYANLEENEIETTTSSKITNYSEAEDFLDQVSITTVDLEDAETEFEKLAKAEVKN